MLQLEHMSDLEWRRLIERLDRGVAEAARAYLGSLHARRVPSGQTFGTKNWTSCDSRGNQTTTRQAFHSLTR